VFCHSSESTQDLQSPLIIAIRNNRQRFILAVGDQIPSRDSKHGPCAPISIIVCFQTRTGPNICTFMT
jgi:hypothetical protein